MEHVTLAMTLAIFVCRFLADRVLVPAVAIAVTTVGMERDG